MAKAPFDPSDDRFTRGIIRRKVKQLIGRAGFTWQDHEDLEQDLFVRVLQSMPRFNPDIAHRNKFITAVVERYVANILRNKKAAKRNHQGILSLNIMIEFADEAPTELAQTINDRQHETRLGTETRSDEELAALAMDSADVISTLFESWKTLLKLRKTQNISAISREMEVPRTTLNDWMRRIRQRCEDRGLQDYL